jgi:hypothetical protein
MNFRFFFSHDRAKKQSQPLSVRGETKKKCYEMLKEAIKINRTASGRTEHCHYHLISFKRKEKLN